MLVSGRERARGTISPEVIEKDRAAFQDSGKLRLEFGLHTLLYLVTLIFSTFLINKPCDNDQSVFNLSLEGPITPKPSSYQKVSSLPKLLPTT